MQPADAFNRAPQRRGLDICYFRAALGVALGGRLTGAKIREQYPSV